MQKREHQSPFCEGRGGQFAAVACQTNIGYGGRDAPASGSFTRPDQRGKSNSGRVLTALIAMGISSCLTIRAEATPPTQEESAGRPKTSQQPALRPHPKAIANTHSPGEVDNPALVPMIVKDIRTLPGIVVDEMDAELEGAWQYSTHTPPYVGLGYLHDQKGGKGKKSVTYRPRIAKEGWYEVRLSHCYNVRRSTNTPVTIRHADGDHKLRINQQEVPKHGKLFRSLGVYRFLVGRDGWIRIANDGTDGKYVIADAVQLIRVAKPHTK